MKNFKQITIRKVASVIFVALLGVVFNVSTSQAQFSQSVVLLKGTVRDAGNGNPVSVKVSIRNSQDTSIEVTASKSNAASGNYLVVLKPGCKYMIHLESDGIQSQDAMIETPSNNTRQMSQDFIVVSRQLGSTMTNGSTLTAMNTTK